MKSEEMIDNTSDNLIKAIRQQVQGKITDEKKFKDFMDYRMGESKMVSKKMVYTDLVRIYDQHFTQQEIKDPINFYKTPTGQKLVTWEPVIQNELMQRMLDNYMPELQAKLQKKLEELY